MSKLNLSWHSWRQGIQAAAACADARAVRMERGTSTRLLLLPVPCESSAPAHSQHSSSWRSHPAHSDTIPRLPNNSCLLLRASTRCPRSSADRGFHLPLQLPMRLLQTPDFLSWEPSGICKTAALDPGVLAQPLGQKSNI